MTASASSTSGLFSSTLSARYDAHTTDITWICVFCKSGPHCSVGGGGSSGDLFGPYLLSPPDKQDMNGEGSADERDITEEQKRSGGRNKRSLRGAHMVEQFCQKMSRKVRRNFVCLVLLHRKGRKFFPCAGTKKDRMGKLQYTDRAQLARGRLPAPHPLHWDKLGKSGV